MHGTLIRQGPTDWQILQHTNGSVDVQLGGDWFVPQAAIDVGVSSAIPVVRVMREEDNFQVSPWQETEFSKDPQGWFGTWKILLSIPAGGLYRIEAGLDTISSRPDLSWMFRGDIRVHIGVGDIFVIAGQSNAAGYGKDSAYDPPDMNVHLLRNRGEWDLACHPMNDSTGADNGLNIEMGVPGVSPYLSFAKRFMEYSHLPVGLVATALGGQPLSRWDRDENGDILADMLRKIDLAGGKIAGILWYQGCSDTQSERAEKYLEKFERFVRNTRDALGESVPFFTFQINRFRAEGDDASWGIVREAQRQAPKCLPGVYALPTLNAPLSDAIHTSAHGNLLLGEHLARQCAHALYNAPDYSAPDIETILYRDQTLTLTFSGVLGKMTAMSSLPLLSGFTAQDADGIIPIEKVQAGQLDSCLILTLQRKPRNAATLSFCYQAIPAEAPPVDSRTALSPLAFYQVPIQL